MEIAVASSSDPLDTVALDDSDAFGAEEGSRARAREGRVVPSTLRPPSVPIAPEPVVALDLLDGEHLGRFNVREQVNCLKLPAHETQVLGHTRQYRRRWLPRSEQVREVKLRFKNFFTLCDRPSLHLPVDHLDSLDLGVAETEFHGKVE